MQPTHKNPKGQSTSKGALLPILWASKTPKNNISMQQFNTNSILSASRLPVIVLFILLSFAMSILPRF